MRTPASISASDSLTSGVRFPHRTDALHRQCGKLLLDLLLEGLPPARVEEGPPFCAYNTTDQWILRLRSVAPGPSRDVAAGRAIARASQAVVSPRGRWVERSLDLVQSQDAGGDLGQGFDEAVDLLRRGEWSGTEPERSIGKRVQCAMNIRGTMQSRTDGDLEADIEDRAQVLGRESLGHDQRESADVGCRIPAPGDSPGFGLLRPVHDLLQ